MTINSPLELEVLIHYHITDDPHHNMLNKEHQKAIDKFISLGIFVEAQNGNIVADRQATQCYLDKIKQIELPKQVWI